MFFYTKSLFRPRGGMAKILLVMRLIIVLLTTAILQVSAIGYAQKVTLKQSNARLTTVLDEIRRQTGYDFVYSDKVMNAAKPVSLNVTNADLSDALEICFKDQPLSFKVEDKMVVIQPKEPTFLERLADRWAAIDISGTVVDEKGYPLPGATVKAKGAKSVITDIKGRFMLEKVEEGATVTISYTGYITQEMPAKQAMGTIALKLSDNPLDQVQIIAYGTQTKRYSLGNVVSVKAADIEKQPVQNVLLALQGRVPGLEITQASGMNGSGVTVRIQGASSIRGGIDPLILIDGVPYPSQTLATTAIGFSLGASGGGASGNGGIRLDPGGSGNPLNYINIADIESVDILKDADATAIYGSRAANGAILITTKKGNPGKTKLDLNYQNGIGKVSKFMNVLNTKQYLEMRREAFKNDGVTIPSILIDPANMDYDINGHWDTTKNTNWQKELIGGTARYNNAILTVSGGSVNTQFRVSGTYDRMSTVFPGKGANQSGNLNFSINNLSQNQRFNIQFSGSYMVNINRLNGPDLTNSALSLAPNAPSLIGTDGELNWAPTAAGNSSFQNPLAYLVVKYQNTANNLVSNLGLSYKIFDGLNIRTDIGYTNQQINEFIGAPLTFYSPEQRLIANPEILRAAEFSNSNSNSWIVEPQLNYGRVFRNHQLNLLLGGTIQQRNSDGIYMRASGFPSDVSLEDIRAATTIEIVNTVKAKYKYVGFFGRLNYNFKEKYLINLTVRRDGSSRFGPSNQFHNFGSIGAGWIFSEEKFLKEKLPFLSFGKLRGSFGTTGNDQIGDYSYLSKLDIMSVPNPYQNTAAYRLIGINNNKLEWEETKKLQVGVDLGLAKDRVMIGGTFVQNRSSNQLLDYILPLIAGTSSITYNFPALVQNRALELTLQTVNFKKKNLEWRTNVNLTLPENKLVSFPGFESSAYAQSLIIGRALNIVKTFEFIGVDPLTGELLFKGKNGPTTVVSERIRDAAIIDQQPKYYGGFQSSITFKKIQFDCSLQFSKSVGLKYLPAESGSFNYGFGNRPIEVLNRWQKPGDEAEYRRYSQLTSFSIGYGNKAYTDISFLRVTNVSLSYQLPTSWKRKVAFQTASIYAHVQNLLTFTNYSGGMDPANPGSISLPPLRVITIGIRASL